MALPVPGHERVNDVRASLSLLYILVNFLLGLARVKVCGGGQCSHVSVCLSLSGSLLIVITCNQLAGDLDK